MQPLEKTVSLALAHLPRHSILITGVSGGADSVAMLRAIHSAGIRQLAVHCNFNLRDDESLRDRDFVETLCAGLGIDLHIEEFDTEKYRREHHLSIEAACRELRYELFRNLKTDLGASRIAVAHNADDNAETLLLALMRGAGLRGLKGMIPDNGEIIRPLLSVSRSRIEDYLSSIGQKFIVDSTNLSTDFRRNFLRHEVIPLLETRWPSARKSIARSASALAADFSLLSHSISSICHPDELRYTDLLSSPAPDSLIFHFIERLGGSPEIAAEMNRCLPSPRVGATWHLPEADIVCGRHAFEIAHRSAAIPSISSERIETTQENLRQIRIPDGNMTLFIPDSPDNYTLRQYRIGDRIQPLGMKGSRLVSDIIREAKLPASQKRAVMVFVDNASGEIIWIPGLKRSRRKLVNMENPPEHIFRIRIF